MRQFALTSPATANHRYSLNLGSLFNVKQGYRQGLCVMHHIPGRCGKIYIDRDKTEAKLGCLDEENY